MKEVLPKDIEKLLQVILISLTPKNRVPMSMDALKGYLFGLAVVPIKYEPEVWVPPIFGGKMPTFDSLEQRDSVFDILNEALNKFITAFEKEKLYFPFDYNPEKPALKYFDRVREWCKGFYESINFHPELWYMDGSVEIPENNIPSIDEIEYETYVLLDIMALQVIKDYDIYKENYVQFIKNQYIKNGETKNDEMNDKSLKKSLLEFFYKAYQTVLFHGYTITHDILQDDESTKDKKNGRNDPCPCGSGKKYKKCCGKNV